MRREGEGGGGEVLDGDEEVEGGWVGWGREDG